MSYVERIEGSYVTNCPAIVVYPTCNFFSQGVLTTLIQFADINGLLYYIDVIGGEVRMRIFEDVES